MKPCTTPSMTVVLLNHLYRPSFMLRQRDYKRRYAIMPKTMKALFVVPGPEGGVYEFRDVPVPTPGPGEVLVAVHAAGTNRGELLARPLLRSDNPAAKPMRAGIEFAGEVITLGEGVKGWKPGDRVMARGPGYAEYAVVSQRALMQVPDGMSWAEAAA